MVVWEESEDERAEKRRITFQSMYLLHTCGTVLITVRTVRRHRPGELRKRRFFYYEENIAGKFLICRNLPAGKKVLALYLVPGTSAWEPTNRSLELLTLDR